MFAVFVGMFYAEGVYMVLYAICTEIYCEIKKIMYNLSAEESIWLF